MASKAGGNIGDESRGFHLDAGDGSIPLIECPNGTGTGGGEPGILSHEYLRNSTVAGGIHFGK